jgi:WD40 repeat protein
MRLRRRSVLVGLTGLVLAVPCLLCGCAKPRALVGPPPLLILSDPGDSVHSVAFAPDGRCLASASVGHPHGGSGYVTAWDLGTGQTALRKASPDGFWSVAFSPDGKLLAAGSCEGPVEVWDAATSALMRTFSGFTAGARCVAFSADGKHLAAAGESLPDSDPQPGVRIWDLTNGQEIRFLESPERLYSIAFSPDGSRLVSGGWPNGTVRVWDTHTGRQSQTLTGHRGDVWGLAFSPDGRHVAAGGSVHWGVKGEFRVWDVASGKEALPPAEQPRLVYAVAYSPDGALLATANADGPIKLWDARQGRELASVEHPYGAASLAFSRDGTRLASGGHGGEVRVWDVAAVLAWKPGKK